ncbi:hypothetical protein [Deinococcus phoenicis]|uniref:hypothetical protein n=1 Tax=Deinococcus phoenicis TaxID=1476583 RepID=UPI000559337E|nr:hypothetical protein [Deinococcus phoenicis]
MLTTLNFSTVVRRALIPAVQTLLAPLRRPAAPPPQVSESPEQQVLQWRRRLLKALVTKLRLPDQDCQLPEALNQPAYLTLFGRELRIVARTPHAREDNFKFSLGHHPRVGNPAYLLLCVDEGADAVHVLLLTDEKSMSYVRFTRAEARHQALVSFPLSA